MLGFGGRLVCAGEGGGALGMFLGVVRLLQRVVLMPNMRCCLANYII